VNGVHDLGGMHGFGPVEREVNEPVFHAPWEAEMVAISNAVRAGGRAVMNIDEFRHGIERMDPVHYLASSYYEHWFDGISRVLIEKDVISADELEKRTAFFIDRPEAPAAAAIANRLPGEPQPDRAGARGFKREPAAELVPRHHHLDPFGSARGFKREPAAEPRFRPGERVVTRVFAPHGHTRLPRYARGKHGAVQRVHGTYVFPDSNAHGLGEQPQPLYSVEFDAHELWGEDAEQNQKLYLDLWESYLRPG
jgi:nitrile hydratase